MNRYSIFAIILIVLMTSFVLFDQDDGNETEITGYADNIHQNENGSTFTIIDPDGNMIKAHYSDRMDDSLHRFKGTYSSDGGIFFVHSYD